MKKTGIIALTAIAVSLVLNWRVFEYWSASQILALPDCRFILAGYTEYAFLPGLAHWLTGSWINLDHQSFRPIASIVHWSQVWLLLHVGGWACTLSVWALLISCATLSGLFACALTGNVKYGAAVAAIIAAVPSVYTFGEWLTWFPISDDLVAIALSLASLIAFTKNRCALTAVLMLLACMTKEIAFGLPLAYYAIKPGAFPVKSVLIVLVVWIWRGIALHGHLESGALSLSTILYFAKDMGPWFLMLAACLVAFLIYVAYSFRNNREFRLLAGMTVGTLGPVVPAGITYYGGHHFLMFFMATLPCLALVIASQPRRPLDDRETLLHVPEQIPQVAGVE